MKITIIFFHLPDRVAVIVFGIITLIAGVILSSVPWLNYFILKVRLPTTSDATFNFKLFSFTTEFTIVEWNA
jgi:hypothetical protein